MCRDCHMKWESKRVVMLLKLDCYWNNLKIIQQLSEEAFEKYLSNLDEYINWLPDGSDKDALIARRLAL
jgi:site-specific recombinase XerC